MAWMERDADRCPGCGLHHSDVEGQRTDRLPVKGTHRFCPGCDAKALTTMPNGVADDKKSAYHFQWTPRVVHPGADDDPVRGQRA